MWFWAIADNLQFTFRSFRTKFIQIKIPRASFSTDIKIYVGM